MSDEPLLRLRDVMLLSALMSVALLALLLFLTRWRRQWMRLLDWEQRFWHRLGVRPEWTAGLRRFEERRGVVLAVAALFVLHVALFAASGGAFLYFKPKLEKARKDNPVHKLVKPQR